MFEDDFPFPKVGYVSSLQGMSICPEVDKVIQVGNQLCPTGSLPHLTRAWLADSICDTDKHKQNMHIFHIIFLQ